MNREICGGCEFDPHPEQFFIAMHKFLQKVLSHLHEIVETLYFHCSLSVCLSVCVCPALLVNKIPVERMHWFRPGFCYTVAYHTGSEPIEIDDLWSKVKVTQYPVFLHNSLLISLMYISALLCLIKLKFGMPIRYRLRRFVFEFHKNQMNDDVMVTPFKVSPYFKSTEPTNFIIGTNIQQNKIHLMIKVQMTLAKADRWRSLMKVKGHMK